MISIHASRQGSDADGYNNAAAAGLISIHASRQGSDLMKLTVCLVDGISIHASRQGSDGRDRYISTNNDISIHASRQGSDRRVKLSPDGRTNQHGFREPGF